MDILIEGTPGAMKLRYATNDKKLTQELEMSWNQAKWRVSLSG